MKFAKLMCGVVAMAALSLGSCNTPKNVTYFQDAYPGIEIEKVPVQQIVIQQGDRLTIRVHSIDERLSTMFNINSQASGGNVGNRNVAYTVNSRGDIDFPVLGEVKVAGLTRQQVAEKIKNELMARDLVKEPVVTVDFDNLSVIMLGSVSPRRIEIDKDNFTLLDAIAAAGDLRITGMRENVKVIRDVNGREKVYTVNMLSAQDLYSSPVYYLQQNDVIYVEPSDKEKRNASNDGNQFYTFSFWLSMATMALSICAIIW